MRKNDRLIAQALYAAALGRESTIIAQSETHAEQMRQRMRDVATRVSIIAPHDMMPPESVVCIDGRLETPRETLREKNEKRPVGAATPTGQDHG